MNYDGLDKQWLSEWCLPILTRDCSVCSREGDVFERTLWPGYLGLNYEAHRVLFVGAIHNENDLRDAQSIGDLAPIAQKWADDRPDDGSTYLEAQRDAYLIAKNSWTSQLVWGLLEKYRRALGDRVPRSGVRVTLDAGWASAGDDR
jgi:hypothetical protein